MDPTFRPKIGYILVEFTADNESTSWCHYNVSKSLLTMNYLRNYISVTDVYINKEYIGESPTLEEIEMNLLLIGGWNGEETKQT